MRGMAPGNRQSGMSYRRLGLPGPLKVPHKAYLWALRNSLISAVNSEMINQRMVDENLPLAGTKV